MHSPAPGCILLDGRSGQLLHSSSGNKEGEVVETAGKPVRGLLPPPKFIPLCCLMSCEEVVRFVHQNAPGAGECMQTQRENLGRCMRQHHSPHARKVRLAPFKPTALTATKVVNTSMKHSSDNSSRRARAMADQSERCGVLRTDRWWVMLKNCRGCGFYTSSRGEVAV